MPEIYIPKEVIPGFESIIRLSKKSVEQISNFLVNSKVSSDPNDILDKLSIFIETNPQIKNTKDLVQTIASFIHLLTEKNDYETVAENLSKSFKEIHSPNINEKDFTSLKHNLSQILKSSVNLNLSVKAYKLLRENNYVYKNSRIVTDIRIVFSDDLGSKNRKAILIHNLHINYMSDKLNKEFFVSLDLDDLKDIQGQIERAIKKDKIIKTDYKNFELI